MITVVHVITKLELGGAQENTLYTCKTLDRSRFRVVLIYGPGGILDDTLPELAQTTEILPTPQLIGPIDPRQDARCFSILRKLFWQLQADHWKHGYDKQTFIVHTHSSKAGVLGRTAARAAEVPAVVHTIHGFGFHEGQPKLKQALFVQAERVASRATDAFIGVSRANLAEAQAKKIIAPYHHREVIRSGMDLEAIQQAQSEREEVRQRLNLTPSDEVILSIANFKPQKDPLTLIHAMHQLVVLRPKVRLLIAGDGPLRPEVERIVKQLELSDRVRLLGWRRDTPQLLAASDLVTLSSIFEGLPRAAVQAVAARRPFVGTRVDGTPEIIRDGTNGYLVPPKDPTALARALAEGLEIRPIDPKDTERIKNWDADLMVRKQESLYEHLIHQKSA